MAIKFVDVTGNPAPKAPKAKAAPPSEKGAASEPEASLPFEKPGAAKARRDAASGVEGKTKAKQKFGRKKG